MRREYLGRGAVFNAGPTPQSPPSPRGRGEGVRKAERETLRRAQLLEQRGLRAHAEDDGVVVVAFAQHLAAGEDLAAQRAGGRRGRAARPSTRSRAKKATSRCAQARRRRRGGGPTARSRRASAPSSVGGHARLGRLVADAVDLVEHQQARHVAGADLGRAPRSVTSQLALEAGSERVDDVEPAAPASSASSSVLLNDATRPCGSLLMKPTVSETRMRGRRLGHAARARWCRGSRTACRRRRPRCR